MNKVVISIFALAIIALGGLTAYTFSPLSKKSIVPQVNPASLTPTQGSAQVGSSTPVALNVYHNRDMAENYYTISVPKAWQLQPNPPAGGYGFTFQSGSASIGLMDVPDNSTLELYILSQDEPSLKKTIPGYTRTQYQKLSVNGLEAYQLTYTSTENGTQHQSVRTYIAGADHAGLLTLTSDASMASQMQPTFNAVVNSFNWEK
ncbi:MAG: hypothetical protein KGH79_02720 [Patescibacteria group bacterium]|nr:hypothetical protein [Patescibacteria group bacterium]